MDNMPKSIEELIEYHNKINEDEPAYNRLIHELDFLDNFIKFFFSKYGEEKAIRNMYDYLEKNDEDTIVCNNIYTINDIYNEYARGMIDFIKDINSITNDNGRDSFNDYVAKFNTAKENDTKFVNSLFAGNIQYDNNPIQNEEPITSAVSNIEYLINLIPRMEDMNKRCSKLNDLYTLNPTGLKEQLLNKNLDMLFDSIRNYYFCAVKEILITYDKIQQKINSKNDNIKKSDSVSDYQVF